MKISEFSAANVSIVLKNEKLKKNAMTENRKSEQIEQMTVTQNKKKTFFVNVDNNTNKRNFLRICRLIIDI